MSLESDNLFFISSTVPATMALSLRIPVESLTLEYDNHLQCDTAPLSLGLLDLPFHHVFSDAGPGKHHCPGLNWVANAAASLALCKQISVLPFFVHSMSLNIDMKYDRLIEAFWSLSVQVLLKMLLDVINGSTW